MTVLEIIGSQQIRIHVLETENQQLRAANHALVEELKKAKPEMFEAPVAPPQGPSDPVGDNGPGDDPGDTGIVT